MTLGLALGQSAGFIEALAGRSKTGRGGGGGCGEETRTARCRPQDKRGEQARRAEKFLS
jgi:hypothetical protein